MYAIIQTGGKQYRVEKDMIIDVELLGDKVEGPVQFKDILLIAPKGGKEGKVLVGASGLSDFVVHGEIVEMTKGKKIESVKYKRRKNQRRKFGHRQKLCRIKISKIAKVDEKH